MSARQKGTCGEAGPRAAHCTEHRMHDHSCYDGGEDVSWNHNQWYDFDLAPHQCSDPDCPDQGYRGPEGRESEYGQDHDPEPEPDDATDDRWERVSAADALVLHPLTGGGWLLVAHEPVAIADQDPDVWGDQA